MKSHLYKLLFQGTKKNIALLIDPEKLPFHIFEKTIFEANKAFVDLILVGGSLTSLPVDNTINAIKERTDIPVILFPGNLLQLSDKADGILLLSLISGRNPEYLIGNHVLASQYIKKSGLEVIPTGYILVDGHNLSSVEYISNTRPIPAEKSDIIVATALAGEQLGLKLIYLEAGSGANDTVRADVIGNVRNEVSIPLMIGGGIKTTEEVRQLFQAGAGTLVIGTSVEKDYKILQSLAEVRNEFL